MFGDKFMPEMDNQYVFFTTKDVRNDARRLGHFSMTTFASIRTAFRNYLRRRLQRRLPLPTLQIKP